MEDHKSTHLSAVVQPAKLAAHGETSYEVTLTSKDNFPTLSGGLRDAPHYSVHVTHTAQHTPLPNNP